MGEEEGIVLRGSQKKKKKEMESGSASIIQKQRFQRSITAKVLRLRSDTLPHSVAATEYKLTL